MSNVTEHEQEQRAYTDDAPAFTATYSPEDNKLRLYAEERLDSETYAKAKACKFQWAPKQQLFYAHWNPRAEDFLLALAGDIGDEAKSVAERAEERAERFETYSDKRASEADGAYNHAASMLDGGDVAAATNHRKAEKLKEKAERAIDRAVSLWETSQYWERRAAGVISSAKYKERPEVRARRIKKLEAENRKYKKRVKEYTALIAAWSAPGLTYDKALQIANYLDHFSMCFTLEKYPRDFETYEGAQSLWGALDKGIITPEQARDLTIPPKERAIKYCERLIAHNDRRLTYERTILAAQGASDLLEPKKRPKQPPLLNYRQPEGFKIRNRYNPERSEHLPQIEMTKAEYSKIYTDYKGTRIVGQHRVRIGMVPRDWPGLFDSQREGYGRAHAIVFLTDSKEHPKPEPVAEEGAQ